MGKDKTLWRGLMLGLLASFFFAFTFVFNRSMNLSGGFWGWSASLRYFMMLPMLAVLLLRGDKLRTVWTEIRRAPWQWLLWSTVGFGLFYAPLTLASVYGQSWFVAATWQITIVAGVFLTPLWGRRIPARQILWGAVILLGVFLLQIRPDAAVTSPLRALVPILIAAVSYPLGNRKMMEVCGDRLTTLQRVFGMTLCSMPFWLGLSVYALVKSGLPSAGQMEQSFFVALFSGVVATLLFFRATELVRENPRRLAVVEATQSGEVIFTLLMGVVVLNDSLPDTVGIIGLALIVGGMVCNSLSAGRRR